MIELVTRPEFEQTGFGLNLPNLPIVDHDFTNSPGLNSSGGSGGVDINDISSEADNRSEDLNVGGGASGTVSEDENESTTSQGYQDTSSVHTTKTSSSIHHHHHRPHAPEPRPPRSHWPQT